MQGHEWAAGVDIEEERGAARLTGGQRFVGGEVRAE
jgi:hypothetical protein